MNLTNELMNNLDTLKLTKIKENINQYLNMMADGVKTPLEAINELVKMELSYKEDLAVVSCVRSLIFHFKEKLKILTFHFNHQ